MSLAATRLLPPGLAAMRESGTGVERRDACDSKLPDVVGPPE
jgi:hypothetical protein